MKTVGDSINYIWKQYFAKSKEDIVSKKEEPENYDDEIEQQGYKKLTPTRRREIASESPLLMKGIRKKSADTFRAWFTVETINGKTLPIKKDLDLIRDFEARSSFKEKLYEARVASHIYGNGFLLIDFLNDEDRNISDPPARTSEPYNVHVLNSEYINSLKYKSDSHKKGDTLYYYYFDSDGREQYIHPDRLLWVPANLIPGHKLGVSTIDLLRWIILSKKNIDIAAGGILSWFSHGIEDIAVENLQPEQKKYYLKVAKTHPSYWVHDTDLELKIKNPTAIDPKPFYDYVVLNIAAGLNMPTHILTGVQMGRVTGAEIGFADYYRDVSDTQELLFSSRIINLYKRILIANNREWKYKLEWNPIYIDENSESGIIEKRVNAADKALNGTKGIGGFISKEEARDIFNNGQIELNNIPPITPKPNIPQNPPIKPEKPNFDEELMIKRYQKLIAEKAKREKELGKKILEEQDNNDAN